ncbi:MAG: AAA family ATPase [Desulfurococcaceae archaeon]
MRRPFIASISGKGGVGKTTLTALLLKVLLDEKVDDAILIVDADPAANLPELIGVNYFRTIGDIVEDFRRKINDINNSGLEKTSLLQYLIMRDCLVETKSFDLLVMGRGEGEGCYCFVNSILTHILVNLLKNYSVILMDMEAGLEHLSRRVDKYVNTLIIVIDQSIMSLRTAERILSVMREVNINPEKVYVVGNKISNSALSKIVEWSKQNVVEYAGAIPYDEQIQEYSVQGKPVLELPRENKAVRAARIIAYNIGLLD